MPSGRILCLENFLVFPDKPTSPSSSCFPYLGTHGVCVGGVGVGGMCVHITFWREIVFMCVLH